MDSHFAVSALSPRGRCYHRSRGCCCVLPYCVTVNASGKYLVIIKMILYAVVCVYAFKEAHRYRSQMAKVEKWPAFDFNISNWN